MTIDLAAIYRAFQHTLEAQKPTAKTVAHFQRELDRRDILGRWRQKQLKFRSDAAYLKLAATFVR